MKPLIGISPQIEDGFEGFTLRRDYLDFIENAGGTAVILTLSSNTRNLMRQLDACDGLLIPGGNDIDPASYGDAPRHAQGPFNPERDHAEMALVRGALKRDLPFLGICRGMQIANVALGGSLLQDIVLSEAAAAGHWQSEPYYKPHHVAQALPLTPLASLVGEEAFAVNSMHHQAIDKLADDLGAAAVSDDGLIEAVFHRTSTFFLGVQWHPETFSTSPASALLARAFTKASGVYAAKRATPASPYTDPSA